MIRPRDRGSGGSGRGFTILEVLIALVVLVIGILGVLALIPAAVQTAGDTVDQLTLAEHAESVIASVRLGARDHTYEVWATDPVSGGRVLKHAFVLLPHPAALPVGQPVPVALRPDGTADPAVFDHRACILLPTGSDKTFVYPRAGASEGGAGVSVENGAGDVLAARDDMARPAGEPLVRAVYGDQQVAADGRPLPGYSFALVIQRARVDGTRRDGLYTVTVLLFKAFRPWTQGAEPSSPVAVYTTELMVGPMTIPGGG
jgi:type II secretory pathway pseudopilin PulG